MNQTLLSDYGNPIERAERAIEAIRQGRGVMVLDDENRENEGDMVFAAETITVEQMALTIRHGSGIVCLCLTDERRQQLELPMMVENNSSQFKTGHYSGYTGDSVTGLGNGRSYHHESEASYGVIKNKARKTGLYGVSERGKNYTSIFAAFRAFSSIKARRGSTSSPISVVNN